MGETIKALPISRSPRASEIILLGLTLIMTGLTVVKETALFWNATLAWQKAAYWLAMHAYYPLWVFNLVLLILLCCPVWHWKRPRFLPFLALLVFALNGLLLTANNLSNLWHDRPLHGTSHGLGW